MASCRLPLSCSGFENVALLSIALLSMLRAETVWEDLDHCMELSRINLNYYFYSPSFSVEMDVKAKCVILTVPSVVLPSDRASSLPPFMVVLSW